MSIFGYVTSCGVTVHIMLSWGTSRHTPNIQSMVKFTVNSQYPCLFLQMLMKEKNITLEYLTALHFSLFYLYLNFLICNY